MSFLIEVYVQPGAKTTEFVGEHDNRLKIRLKSGPVEGKANKELISFVAKFLKLRKQDVNIISGEKSRLKTLSIATSIENFNSLLLLKKKF